MTTAEADVRQKFRAEKATVGGITVVTMHGTLDEGFEGHKMASSIRSKKMLVDMSDVRRFASWGMSEWMDFLRVSADCDIYIVECSTYALSQLALVTGLLGHAKLTSFYASYQCTGCSQELQTLFVIPRDAIRDLPGSYRECPHCGSRAHLEEYPAAFFDTIASRPAFDIDDEVLAYMRSHLNYDLSPDLTRFRAYRRVQKDYTYLRLTGNIATLPPDVLANATAGTTVLDLEGAVFDPVHLGNWFTYVQSAMPKTRTLQLLDCPGHFLESAVRVEDLRDRMKVRTFQQTSRCGTCEATTTTVIDVAQNLEELVRGVVPVRCTQCRSPIEAVLTPEGTAVLRALPARDRDVALDAFIAKSKAEPSTKLENVLAAARYVVAAQGNRKRRILFATSSVGVLLVAGAVLAVLQLSNRHSQAGTEDNSQINSPVVPPPKPQFTRPEWIISDVPSSAYCNDINNRLMCVGVSSYRSNKDEGVGEATDAALEELVNTVGLKISDPYFRDTVMPSYSEPRSKALAALQTATQDRNNSDPKAMAAYAAATNPVREARKNAVAVLKATAGGAIPAQRSDWYWEEYARDTGDGTEFLVFVRYDVTLDQVRTLVDKYSSSKDVLGSTAITAFPSLAWRRAGFHGGALLTKVGPPLAGTGVAEQQLVVAVGDQRVSDAGGFARAVEGSPHHDIALTVVANADSGSETVVHVKR